MPDPSVSQSATWIEGPKSAACPGCGHIGGMGITKQNRYWHAHCWIKRIEAERDRYRNALDAILAEAREADDGWTITTCEKAIQGTYQERIEREEYERFIREEARDV